jgi:hypothetical protein
MKVRGSDGSKSEKLGDHISVGRLKGHEQQAVRGRTADQVTTTVARVLKAMNN